MPLDSIAKALAKAFLAGEPDEAAVLERGVRTLGRRWRWLGPLARRYASEFGGANWTVRPRHRDALQFLRLDAGFRRALLKHGTGIKIDAPPAGPETMRPAAAARDWNIPAIESVGALAEWLALDVPDVEWFADLRGFGAKFDCDARLQHYRYRVLAKGASGHIRLIEAPKPRLKELQRRILEGILEKVPAHPAAHGFLKGRSIGTFARLHVGQRVVLRMDLRDFFPSIAGARVQTFFRAAGYPEQVADLLGGICTNSTPGAAWRASDGLELDRDRLFAARQLHARPHLPQGAPTSPALANICAHRMDVRLAGLAEAAGATYTRYADDLAFSGSEEFARCVERFSTHVAAVAMEEGFAVNHRKTRIMRRGVRQHLAGLVINDRLNIRRSDFDLLKAVLTNCARVGPESQNREGHASWRAHLNGRVAFVESVNPAKGRRLRAIFDRIAW